MNKNLQFSLAALAAVSFTFSILFFYHGFVGSIFLAAICVLSIWSLKILVEREVDELQQAQRLRDAAIRAALNKYAA